MAEKESPNPLWLAVFALLIPQCIAIYQEHNKFELEQAQFESNLILRAIDPNDRKKTEEAVRFLVRAGFVSEGKILNAIKDTTLSIPTVAEETPAPSPTAAYTVDKRPTFSGIITDEMTQRPVAGATVSASAGSVVEKMVTGKDGRFTLHYPTLDAVDRLTRRNRPISWSFTIIRPGYQPYAVWEPGAIQFPHNSTFALEPISQGTIGDKIFNR